jgi:heat shock protein 5
MFVEDFKIKLCEKQNSTGFPSKDNVSYEDVFVYRGDKFKTFSMKYSEFEEACKKVFDQVENCITGKEEGVIGKYKNLGGDIKEISKILLVGGSSRIPSMRNMLARIFGAHKLDFRCDADTVVAEGACYYAANIGKFLDKEKSIHLVDVVPMSIGICVNEDNFESILEKDSTIPASGSKVFTTAVDNQSKVMIKVAQGLRFEFKENNFLGEFELTIDKPAPRGVPQIEVTVSIDKDRKVSVTALDKNTDKKADIEFKRSDYTLSSEAIAKMVKDKEANEAKDNELRERYNERSSLESYIDSVKSRMVAPSVNEENRTTIDKAILGVQTWLKSERDVADKIAFREKYENLKNVVEPLLAEKETKPPMPDMEPPKDTGREDL